MQMAQYATADRAALMVEYVARMAELAEAHRTLATVTADQHRDFWKGWSESDGQSVAQRMKDAEYEARITTLEVIGARGEVNSLVTQCDCLRSLLRAHEVDAPVTPLVAYPPGDLAVGSPL
jgi:hypothetical protein